MTPYERIPCPEIVAYQADGPVPAGYEWIAYHFSVVTIRPEGKEPYQSKAPQSLYFRGSTKEAATAYAAAFWEKEQDRLEQQHNVRQRAIASAKAKREPTDAP